MTIAGAVLAWLLGLYALHCWYARCFNLLYDAAAACQWVARSGLASFSREGSQHGQARPLGTSNGRSSQMGSRTSSKVSLPATPSLGNGIAGSNSGAEEPDLEEALAAAARQLKREQLARRVNAWRLESLGKRGHGMVHTLVDCLQVGRGSPSGLCLCCLMGQAIPCLPTPGPNMHALTHKTHVACSAPAERPRHGDARCPGVRGPSYGADWAAAVRRLGQGALAVHRPHQRPNKRMPARRCPCSPPWLLPGRLPSPCLICHHPR